MTVRPYVLLLLSGCLFPSLDDLSSPVDGSTTDVSADISTSDVVDAATSDGAPSDATPEASGPFCPQAGTLLCADFDEADGGFQGAWTLVYAPGTTTIQESTAFFTSSPRSIFIATTSTDKTAFLRENVDFTDGITLEFNARITARGSGPSIAAFVSSAGALTIQPKDTATNVLEAIYLADGGTAYNGMSNAAVIPVDAWVHVFFDFDRVAKKATVSVDGTPLVSYAPTNAAWGTTTSVALHLGIGSSDTETAYFDDVTIRTR